MMSSFVDGKRKRKQQQDQSLEMKHIRSVIDDALHTQNIQDTWNRVFDIAQVKNMLKLNTGKKRVTLNDLKTACKTRHYIKLIQGIVAEKVGIDLALAFRYAVLFPEKPINRLSILSGVAFDDRPTSIGMGYQMFTPKRPRSSRRSQQQA